MGMKHRNSDPTKSPDTNAIKSAGFIKRLGKISLGGNATKQQEAFTGGKYSVAELAKTLPKLPAGVETRINSNEVTHGVGEGDNYTSVMGVVLAGDTAVAITRTNKPGSRLPIVNIVELPYGEHSSEISPKTGKLLQTIDPNTLNQARQDGVVQPWETFKFGRSEKNGTNPIGQSPLLSREAFSITLGAGGDVSVTDLNSTNGTSLITGQTINQNTDNDALMSLHNRIADPAMAIEWSGAYAQHTAFVPNAQ